MTQKLKPCPFCNGEPIVDLGTFGNIVSCQKCDATMQGDDAIKQWNTRHEPKREFVVNPSKQP